MIFGGYVQNYEYLSEPFEIIEGVFIPAGVHRFNEMFISVQSDQSRVIGGRTEVEVGDFYNGTLFSLQSGGKVKFSKHFNMEVMYTRDQVNLPVPGGRFTTTIVGTRVIYAFTPNLFAKAYIQWNDSEDRFRSNFLIRWIYKPGANIYLIYNETRLLGLSSYLEDRTVMLKVSFLFNL
jgi:hypothetical protein